MTNVFTYAMQKAHEDFLERNPDCDPRTKNQRVLQRFHDMDIDQKKQAMIIAQQHKQETDALVKKESAVWLKMQTKMRTLQQKIDASKKENVPIKSADLAQSPLTMQNIRFSDINTRLSSEAQKVTNDAMAQTSEIKMMDQCINPMTEEQVKQSRPSDVNFVDKYCSPFNFPQQDENQSRNPSKQIVDQILQSNKSSKKRDFPQFLNSIMNDPNQGNPQHEIQKSRQSLQKDDHGLLESDYSSLSPNLKQDHQKESSSPDKENIDPNQVIQNFSRPHEVPPKKKMKQNEMDNEMDDLEENKMVDISLKRHPAFSKQKIQEMFSNFDSIRQINQTLPQAISLTKKELNAGTKDQQNANQTQMVQNFSFGDESQARNESQSRDQDRISKILPEQQYESESQLQGQHHNLLQVAELSDSKAGAAESDCQQQVSPSQVPGSQQDGRSPSMIANVCPSIGGQNPSICPTPFKSDNLENVDLFSPNQKRTPADMKQNRSSEQKPQSSISRNQPSIQSYKSLGEHLNQTEQKPQQQFRSSSKLSQFSFGQNNKGGYEPASNQKGQSPNQDGIIQGIQSSFQQLQISQIQPADPQEEVEPRSKSISMFINNVNDHAVSGASNSGSQPQEQIHSNQMIGSGKNIEQDGDLMQIQKDNQPSFSKKEVSQNLNNKTVDSYVSNNACTANMYNEFLDCNSFMYQMPDREDSSSISSDGEFNEFKQYDLIDEDDPRFVDEKYQELLKEKYLEGIPLGEIDGSSPHSSRGNSKKYQNYLKYADKKYIDEELQCQAIEFVQSKAQGHQHFSKRLVTQNAGVTLSRWASDMSALIKISRQQQETIHSDAIFGRIDPRDTNMVVLKEIFNSSKDGGRALPSQMRKYNQKRGSSAKPWNDTMEFATPNVIQKEDEKHFKINPKNVNQITSFNPYDVIQPQGSGKPRCNTKAKFGVSMKDGRNSKVSLNSDLHGKNILEASGQKITHLNSLYPSLPQQFNSQA